jgi:uncharacterized membrane-anchored protein YhcB (DUF1043 family)
MSETVVLTVVEFVASLILEGVILGFIFQLIANREQKQQEQHLKDELNNIEIQNRANQEQLLQEIYQAKTEIISQIKEVINYDKGRKN